MDGWMEEKKKEKEIKERKKEERKEGRNINKTQKYMHMYIGICLKFTWVQLQNEIYFHQNKPRHHLWKNTWSN